MKRQRPPKIGATWSERLDESRIHLARPDALLPLAFLGLLTGLLAGGVVTAQNVAEERRQAEQQTPAVEVQQIKSVEDESTSEIGW